MEEKIYISELAGHCIEPTAWQLLKEVSEALIREGLRPVNPYCIEINDDGHFSLTSTEATEHQSFIAPECIGQKNTEPGSVWSLGATVFYTVMGRQVMNDKGSKGQKESSKLPYIRSEWPELSELVQHCLHFNPARRPSLKEIHDKATQQYKCCSDMIQRGPKIRENDKDSQNETAEKEQELAFWPEKI